MVAAACGKSSSTTSATPKSTTAATMKPLETTGTPGGTVKLAVEQEPTGLNWLNAADNAAWTSYLMRTVWPGAVSVNPDTTQVFNKDLVTSVELTNKSPQTVVYKINPAAVWSDGQPITADDFIYYWTAQNGKATTNVPDPDNPGHNKPLYEAAGTTGYEDIASVTGSDNGKTVTAVFDKPFADWMGLWDFLLPKHAFAAAGGGDPAKGFNSGFKVETLKLANVVSGGPYMVTAYNKGQSMTLERNPKYWGKPGLVDKIIAPFITDATQQPRAVDNEEADVAFPQAQLDLVKQFQALQSKGVTSEIGFGAFWEHLDFNQTNPDLKSLNVRKAIALSINRALIVKALPAKASSEAQVLNNRMFFPGKPHYQDNGAAYAKQDLTAAAKLMKGAGYTKSGAFWTKNGKRLSLRLSWKDPNPRRQQECQLIQAQLKQLGIDVVLTPKPSHAFLDAGDFDMALFGWTGSAALSANTSIYVAGGGQNYSKNNDPKIKTLFDQANVDLDPVSRAKTMNDIDKQLWLDLPQIPLFQVPEIIVSRTSKGAIKGAPAVHNVRYNGYDGPTWNASGWFVTAG
jgi:peptide/nickel transport system substrate-binding protein